MVKKIKVSQTNKNPRDLKIQDLEKVAGGRLGGALISKKPVAGSINSMCACACKTTDDGETNFGGDSLGC
jgi:hypothetical protein